MCQGANLGEKKEEILAFQELLEKKEKMLPEKEALLLAEQIRPVMTEKDGVLEIYFPDGLPQEGTKFFVSPGKIFNESYSYGERKRVAEAKGLVKAAEILTYHRSPYYGRLCPSVYEVLYQIPPELREVVCAFELYYTSDSLYCVYNSTLDRHRLHCVLYSGVLPQEVYAENVLW